jgi:hypothetical protein
MRVALLAGLLAASMLLSADDDDSATNLTAEAHRPLSAHINNALTDALPKYRPPRTSTEVVSTDATSDREPFLALPEPKNGIVRLPRVVVEGERPPVFSEREIHTDKGFSELLIKRYFTDVGLMLNRVRLPFFGMSKEAYAMMLWREDERLRLLREYGEEAQISELLGEPNRAAELRDILHDTLSHQPLFLGAGQVPFRDARGR